MLASGFGSLLRTCLSSARRAPLPTLPSLKRHASVNALASASSSTPSDINASLARTEVLYKTYKPVTPGIRHLRRPLNPHLWEGRPIRQLTVAQRKKGGRNNHGRITVRARGGGHKRRIRLVDFTRMAPGPHDVVRIEYDPGRSAHIALIKRRVKTGAVLAALKGDQIWSYILAPEGLRAGDVVESYRMGIPKDLVPNYTPSQTQSSAADNNEDVLSAESETSLSVGLLRSITLKPGNVLPLHLIPVGTIIHNISLKPKGPGILVRSAGTYAQVTGNEPGAKYVLVRLQSGEVRKVLRDCCATVGSVSNPLWKNRSLGKAGRNRWLGRRPHVRGMAMNAVDHPHGGGRGKLKGNKPPRSLWGWQTKGKRTRRPGPKGPKNSNKFVVEERPRGVQKRQN
ncbi:ribosomal protein L2 [Punctularia strigosozonata HHB-11173 SS5]|uniref:ribosomal protein L2 n=1 Tax=Punctularia strigosozonata (strain HHB-11173) TaxID=741275 RepID=UPI000441767A|nr:ribosomal protein L2 [Punctularia strigosozonata HHB-11173 SS5]EIN14305.1 ribosomal protein L2 [Punctularia strigosozonata HHB-11173 SS5]